MVVVPRRGAGAGIERRTQEVVWGIRGLKIRSLPPGGLAESVASGSIDFRTLYHTGFNLLPPISR